MRNRRDFITAAAGAAVGMLAGGSGLLDARAALRAGRRANQANAAR